MYSDPVPVPGRADGRSSQEASMAFMNEHERMFARGVSELALSNPFLPDWVSIGQKVLGAAFETTKPVWHAHPVPLAPNPNVATLNHWVGELARTLRQRLAEGVDPGEDVQLYRDLVTYVLYASIEPDLKR